jgi:hypothetical protein
MSKKIIGKCGLCGGPVSVPVHWMSVKPPVPECESCGAQADTLAHVPTIPMKPRDGHVDHVQRETRTDGSHERSPLWPKPPTRYGG